MWTFLSGLLGLIIKVVTVYIEQQSKKNEIKKTIKSAVKDAVKSGDADALNKLLNDIKRL